jgi:AraC family transcriptional regulator
MPFATSLELQFATGTSEPVERQPLRWRGFEIEQVKLETDQPYGFHASGGRHYLALHDLVLSDGELRIDGLPKISQTDLRDTLTYAPGGCVIDGWAKPTSRRNAYTALYFDPASISADLGERFDRLEPAPFAYAKNPALAGTMKKLATIAGSPEVDDLYAEALCLSAALEIFGVRQKTAGTWLSQWQLRTIYDFVEANLDRNITLDEMADLSRLSRSHFSRSFKAATGIGPHGFVRQRQIKRACELLQQKPAVPIETVARAVGFRSASVFRRAFQAVLGISPQEYRLAKR